VKSEDKTVILSIIEMLKIALKETDTFVGVQIEESDYNQSKLAFVGKEAYKDGRLDGFTISFDELNKEVRDA